MYDCKTSYIKNEMNALSFPKGELNFKQRENSAQGRSCKTGAVVIPARGSEGPPSHIPDSIWGQVSLPTPARVYEVGNGRAAQGELSSIQDEGGSLN